MNIPVKKSVNALCFCLNQFIISTLIFFINFDKPFKDFNFHIQLMLLTLLLHTKKPIFSYNIDNTIKHWKNAIKCNCSFNMLELLNVKFKTIYIRR